MQSNFLSFLVFFFYCCCSQARARDMAEANINRELQNMDNFLKVVIILSVTCTSNLCIAASLNYHILVCFLMILQKLRIMSYILSLPMPNNRHSTLFFLDLLPVSAGSKLLVLLYSVLQEFEKSCFTKDTQVCTWEKLLGNLTLFSADFGSKPNLVVPIPAEVVVLSKHNAK